MFGKQRGQREAMSKVDTAWLRMESPTNLMMITGVLMFEQRMPVPALKRLLAERFLAFRRFRQKAVDSGSSAYWEDDADFDMDWHVRLTALPGRADKLELEKARDLLRQAQDALSTYRPRRQGGKGEVAEMRKVIVGFRAKMGVRIVELEKLIETA